MNCLTIVNCNRKAAFNCKLQLDIRESLSTALFVAQIEDVIITMDDCAEDNFEDL